MCITLLALIFIKSINYRFYKFPWYPPISWGLPKELFLDPTFSSFFHGKDEFFNPITHRFLL